MANIILQEQDILEKRILTNRLSRKRIRSGVTAQGKNLQVSATQNQLYIDFGSAYIEGTIFSIEEDSGTVERYAIPLPNTAPMTYRVILRKEYSGEAITVQPVLKPGTVNAVPQLARIANEVYEISLAAVLVNENGNVIVIDERFDDTVCGLSELELDGNELMNMMYPVGSIYMTCNPISPSNLFGGTWEAWGTGRVPVGIDTSKTEFNTVEKLSGSMSHDHRYRYGSAFYYGLAVGDQFQKNDGTFKSGVYNYRTGTYAGTSGSMGTYTVEGNTSLTNSLKTSSSASWYSEGYVEIGSSVQPSIVCYMWKRIA